MYFFRFHILTLFYNYAILLNESYIRVVVKSHFFVIGVVEYIILKRRINVKSTGIVRKVDELGRVVLPIELRRSLNINEKDSLEIFVDDNKIILKKYEPADIFSGSMEDLIDYKGKRVSKASIEEMAKIIGLI